MGKTMRMGSQAVQSSLHSAYPHGAVSRRIHGIDGIRRETRGIVFLMTIILHLQEAWSQFCNAASLCTYPYLSVLGEETVDEVTAQRVTFAVTIPMLHLSRLAIDDVHTAKCTHEELVLGRDGKARHHLMLQGTVGERIVKILLVAAEETFIGGKPNLAII